MLSLSQVTKRTSSSSISQYLLSTIYPQSFHTIYLPITMASDSMTISHENLVIATKTAAAQFVQETKMSAYLSYNWDELLTAAPIAISLLATCIMAASPQHAERIKLERPSGGWKYVE